MASADNNYVIYHFTFILPSSEIVEKALSLTEDNEDKDIILELTILMGEINYLAGDINKAVDLFESVVNLTDTSGENQFLRSLAMSFLGKCYILLGKYNIALVNGQQALLLSAKINFIEGRLKAYESLAFIYENMHRYEDAFSNLKSFYAHKEIFDKENSEKNLSRIKAYYGTFEKELEIDKQQIQIENLEQSCWMYIVLLLHQEGHSVPSEFSIWVAIPLTKDPLAEPHKQLPAQGYTHPH